MLSARLTLIVVAAALASAPQFAQAQTFQLSFPSATNAGPITGRAFLFVARQDKEEPRLQSGASGESEPFFGVDIEALTPGKSVTIDANVLGYPVASLKQLDRVLNSLQPLGDPQDRVLNILPFLARYRSHFIREIERAIATGWRFPEAS